MTVWLVILWLACFILWAIAEQYRFTFLAVISYIGMAWAGVWSLAWFLTLAF